MCIQSAEEYIPFALRAHTIISAALVAASILLFACDGIKQVDPFGHTRLGASTILDSAAGHAIEGVYRVEMGDDIFGTTVVLKWNGRFCNLLAEKDGIVAAMHLRRDSDRFLLEGRAWWNDSQRMQDLSFEIWEKEGADSMALGIRPTRIVIRATDGLVARFVLLRPVNPKPFFVVAHRGGFNNSGQFNIPDNSLEMIRTAQDFGANAIELDVRVTKDGVPIIFHDDNFTPRLVNGEFLFGAVSGFTFSHIRNFGTLKNGERIPTLREALDEVLVSTAIDFVEFDVKNPETIAPLFDIQRDYHAQGRAMGRSLSCYIDLPTEEIANAFIRDKRHPDALCMCELDEMWIDKSGARIWSPRWTIGTSTDRARSLKERGILFVPWTVNEPQFIDALLNEAQADGVLTDVPNIVAFKWYSR